jgi:hypothetical protein
MLGQRQRLCRQLWPRQPLARAPRGGKGVVIESGMDRCERSLAARTLGRLRPEAEALVGFGDSP